MIKKILLAFFLFASFQSYAQMNLDTLAIQDFELIPQAPVWTFTGPVIYNSGYSTVSAAPPSSPLGIGGSRAWETTVNSGGLILEFANVNIPAGYDSIRVHFNLAALNLAGATGGPDHLDYVLTEVSTDAGVTYYARLRIRGAVNNNSFWPYSATGIANVYYQPQTEAMFQPVNTGLATTLGYSNCEIVFPGSVTQVRVRITGRSSSSTDTWMIDNVLVTGENNCTPSASAISPDVCNSYLSPSGNYTWTASGTYQDTLPNSTGCDSVITVNLNVRNSSVSSISASACNSYISPSGNFTWTTSGNYSDTIPNAAGCDSVISINLSISNSTNAAISPAQCYSYTSPSGNFVWTTSGIYSDTLSNASGCDSVIAVNLTIFNSSMATISASSCDDYNSPSGNYLWTASGTYSDTIPNAEGCDSVITVNLTITTIDTSVVQTGPVLTANAAGAMYQWIDCGNGNIPVAGATAQSFTAALDGDYAVIITLNGCPDTSSCFSVVFMALNDVYSGLTLHVYPNPVNDQLSISVSEISMGGFYFLADYTGRILIQGKLAGLITPVDLHALPAGVYFLSTTVSAATAVKIVKE